MINEEISEILNRDLIVSTERGFFSSPSEITQHVNALLDASYSTRAISTELQEIGWQRCGSSRAKRKHDNKSAAYYWKENRQSKALLLPSTKTQSNSASSEDEDESLASIDRRFKIGRANKEISLSKTREIESKSAKHREKHLELELQKERRELISVEKVSRYWNEAIMYMRNSLYELPMKFSDRWASEVDGGVIHDELIKELDIMCRKWSDQGEKAISQDEDEDI